MTEDERSADYDPTCGGCVAGTDPWHTHAGKSDSRPASGASRADQGEVVTQNKRLLSTVLFVLSGIALGVTFGFWFAGIWTHGHDAASRMSATGFLTAVVACGFAILGAVARGAER